MQDAFIAELQKDENEAYPIVSLRKPVASGGIEEFSFKIDKTIGKDTSIIVTYTNGVSKTPIFSVRSLSSKVAENHISKFSETTFLNF